MDAMLVKTVAIGHRTVNVVRLEDRRGGGNSAAIAQDWCYQKQLEDVLYDSGFGRSTGAMNKLLSRCAAGTGPSLPLQRSSIAAGWVTEDEFEWLYTHLHTSARSFTLVPLSSVEAALETYGANARSEALVTALGLARPAAWGAVEEESGGEEEAEAEAEEDVEEDADESDAEDEDGAGGAFGGGSESEDDDEDSDENDDEMDDGETSIAPTDVMEGEPPTVDAPMDTPEAHVQRRAARYALTETPELAAELDAFEAHRAEPLLAARNSVAVTAPTRQTDRGSALRLMGWLSALGKLPQPPSLSIFASPAISTVVERFVKLHCDPATARGKVRSYKWAANHVGSFLALTRFAGTRTQLAPSALEQLEALHKQTLQQSRLQTMFAVGKAPVAWLDWPAVLRARVAAERAFAAYTGDDLDHRLALTRTVLLMRLHSDHPPDRVGVLRTLCIGGTLRRDEDAGWWLSLSEPDQHKTSKIFGSSSTELNAACAAWLNRYLALACVPSGGYLFHGGDDPTTPLAPSAWTRLVQRAYATHTGVKLCPKDLRASYITFLRSDDVEDDLVRETAIAMRHSSSMAASAAYDKNGTQPVVDRAMRAAARFSAKFVA